MKYHLENYEEVDNLTPFQKCLLTYKHLEDCIETGPSLWRIFEATDRGKTKISSRQGLQFSGCKADLKVQIKPSLSTKEAIRLLEELVENIKEIGEQWHDCNKSWKDHYYTSCLYRRTTD